MNGKKPIYVAFGERKLENEFEELKEGKFEDRQLHDFICRAITDLKSNPSCGIKIPKILWPKEYIKKFDITNLWKRNLPDGWRLIYTIQTNEIMILSVILEWFDHKEYEKRFKY
jgi:Txe/YoeB family toxin of Txe-Axe toxin-antitoxin module